MADETDVRQMCAGEAGNAAFEQLQEVFIAHNLTASEGVCAGADFIVWVIMTAFRRKQDAKDQLSAMVPGLLASIDANWDSLEARRQVLDALESGESGGRLQ